MLLVSPSLSTSRCLDVKSRRLRGNWQLQFSINLLLVFPVGSQGRARYSPTVSLQYLEHTFDCLGLRRSTSAPQEMPQMGPRVIAQPSALLAIAMFLAIGSIGAQAQAANAKKPNILFIMGDDIGWM